MRIFVICAILSVCSLAQAEGTIIRGGEALLARSGGPDAMSRVGAQATLASGLQMHLQIAAVFTSERLDDGTSGPNVNEWQILSGFGYRFAKSGRHYFDFGFLVGPVFRQFPDQLSILVSAEVPVTWGIRLSENLAIEIRVAPGYAKKTHFVDEENDATWHRGPVFLDAGVMLAYDFDPHAGEHRPID